MDAPSKTRNLANTRPPLIPRHLTLKRAEELSQRLAPMEVRECAASGHTPAQALIAGISHGWSRCAVDAKTQEPVGAFGFTRAGLIWSLWAPLTRRAQVQVLRESPQWIRNMVAQSRRPKLHNFVHASNTQAVQWITATKCFLVGDDVTFHREGEPYLYFETLPHLAAHERHH